MKKIETTRCDDKTRTRTRPKSSTSEKPKVQNGSNQTDQEHQCSNVNIQIFSDQHHLLNRPTHVENEMEKNTSFVNRFDANASPSPFSNGNYSCQDKEKNAKVLIFFIYLSVTLEFKERLE